MPSMKDSRSAMMKSVYASYGEVDGVERHVLACDDASVDLGASYLDANANDPGCRAENPDSGGFIAPLQE